MAQDKGHIYMFSEIPNDEEGQKFLKQLKKYLNKSRYSIRVKGQYLIDSEKYQWQLYSRGQPINKSKCLRIYITDYLTQEKNYNIHLTNYDNENKIRKIKEILG